MIRYSTEPAGLTESDLAGFFVGWPRPPADRVAVLRGADHVVLAYDGDRLVGFVTALSDGVLMAYLPLLEVLPEYQRSGVGTELVNRVLAEIGDVYGVDVCCDDDVVPYYERFGFQRVNGMVLRRR
ncbi:MAG TPA: GNAT family N-acetyltransferase [Pseudonocardiaceae bacterium]|nr:GNAT family N-acetyltransferase [Pseudonocardiaceae bacterium]